MLNKVHDYEVASAWLLSRLARRHIGYAYLAKQRQADMTVDTWILKESLGRGVGLQAWFDDTPRPESFRLYLHAYPINQIGRALWSNVFRVPHRQVGTRRGRYRNLRAICTAVQPLLDGLADLYSDHEYRAVTAALSEVGPCPHSKGYPAR